MSEDWEFQDIKITKNLNFALVKCHGETYSRQKRNEEAGGCLDGSKFVKEDEGVTASHSVFNRVLVFDLDFNLVDEIDIDIGELFNGAPTTPFSMNTVLPNPYEGYSTRISDWLKIDAFDSSDGKSVHLMIMTKSIPDKNIVSTSVNQIVSEFDIDEDEIDYMLMSKGVPPMYKTRGRTRKVPSHGVTGSLSKSGQTRKKTVYDVTRPTVNINLYKYKSKKPYRRVDKSSKIAQIFINSPVEHKHI
jgi:hypothetical protein